MKRRTWTLGGLTFLAAIVGGSGAATPAPDGQVAPAKLLESYGRLPLRFEPNQGQTDPSVKFVSRGGGYTLFLEARQATLTLERGSGAEAPGATVLRMKLAGASASPRIASRDPLPGRSHYLIGNDPRRWRTGVPHYAAVEYRGVYPGVDLTYYGNQRKLEYDFVVAPGADPYRIALEFEGARAIRFSPDGDLLLETSGGELRQHRPLIYQQFGQERRIVPGGYVLRGPNRVGFRLAAYDRSRPLVIDPAVSYATYFGGASTDRAFGVAVDSLGQAYITGVTSSGTLPSTAGSLSGASDAFVMKLSATGAAVVYATYLGGTSADQGNAIAVTGAGVAYVTGKTNSTNFPVVPSPSPGPVDSDCGTSATPCTASAGDAFAVRLNAAGTVDYSTFLGGAGNDTGLGIAVDGTGRMHVAGQTSSSGLPVTANAPQAFLNGGSDAFVAVINPAVGGSAGLVFLTYLGGSDTESGNAIAVDSSGKSYLTGETSSWDFPDTPTAFQADLIGITNAFIAKLDPAATTPAAALPYASYLGGGETDRGLGIAVDSSNNVYITGSSLFSSIIPFPTTTGAFQTAPAGSTDAFVAKFNPTAATAAPTLVYSTLLGSTGGDQGKSIAVDAGGNAYVAGHTGSTGFPTAGPTQPVHGGANDAFVTKLNATGSALLFSTFLGGASDDLGSAVALDSTRAIYVAGQAGLGFPTTAGSLQATYAGGLNDAFVAKYSENNAPTANAGTDQIVECAATSGTAVTLNGAGSSDPENTPLTYTWTGPFGTASGVSPTVTLAKGVHTITLVVSDGSLSSPPDTVQITVRDTTNPTLLVSLAPNSLLPADDTLRPIAATIQASDSCSASTSVSLVSITSDGSLAPGDIADAVYSTDDRAFSLRAKTSPGGLRTYVVTYQAADAENLTTTQAANVTVANSAPTANAGAARTVECNAPNSCSVTLNGSASSDPDGDALTYQWSWLPSGSATGVGPTVNLPQGATTVTLVVSDGLLSSPPATVVITVADTTQPSLTVSLSPNVLSPPNHNMIPITATVQVSDICDPNPSVVLLSITANEPLEPGDFQGADFGSDDRSFQLRSERSGNGNGRIYTVTYRAADVSGNRRDVSQTVTVPKNQSGN